MLHSSTAGQLLVFLSNIFWGLTVSFGFHLIFASTKKIDAVLRLVIEAVFGVLSLFGLWFANFVFNLGQFRFFLILGMIAGCFLYCKILRSMLDKVFVWLYNLIYKKTVSKVDNEGNIPK